MNRTRDLSGSEAWWNDHVVPYEIVDGRAVFEEGSYELGCPAFFERVESYSRGPAERLLPFDRCPRGQRVLDIGCGVGTMAARWAENGAAVTAVDLSSVAVDLAKRLFAHRGLEGDIRRGDATALPFPDGAFDYVYSWGALHYAADLRQSIVELTRVLRPGGSFGVLVSHRGSFAHWYHTRFLEGFLHYERRFLDPVELASRYADSAYRNGTPYLWPVTRHEAHDLFGPLCESLSVRVIGDDLDTLFRWLLPGVSRLMPRIVKKCWGRRVGRFLWITGTMPS